jgi:hypothetical protein
LRNLRGSSPTFVRTITLCLFAGLDADGLNLDTDATGHPTVGYGHLCSDSRCSDVKYKIPLSKSDGKQLLADDMRVS